MTCKICGKELHDNGRRVYCSDECYKRGQYKNRRARIIAKRNFEIEWAAWKRDFALGKTAPNL